MHFCSTTNKNIAKQAIAQMIYFFSPLQTRRLVIKHIVYVSLSVVYSLSSYFVTNRFTSDALSL